MKFTILALLLLCPIITCGNNKIAVIGDSASSQEPMFGQAWPTRLSTMFQSLGMGDYELRNFAHAAATFNTALNVKDYFRNTNTQLDVVVDYDPSFVIVILSDGQPLNTETKDFVNAKLFFDSLKKRLPNAKVLYVAEKFCSDSPKFKADVIPKYHTPTQNGLLKDTFNDSILTEPLPESVLHICSYYSNLHNYVKSLNTIDYYGVLDAHTIATLGGVVEDGIHPNLFGQSLEVAAIVEILKDIFPEILFRDGFNLTLSNIKSKYVENDFSFLRNLKDFNAKYSKDWFLPKKIVAVLNKNITGSFILSVYNGYPNSAIYMSTDGHAFFEAGKTDEQGYALIEYPIDTLPDTTKHNDGVYGDHTVYVKNGNVALGPYVVTVN